VVLVRAISTAMRDQIIDAAMAQALQTDASQVRPIIGWIVMRDTPAHPDRFVARLVTDRATAHVLVADTLDGLQAQLPAGLTRVERQPADVPQIVELWFPA
jgi:hypothetical protein